MGSAKADCNHRTDESCSSVTRISEKMSTIIMKVNRNWTLSSKK